MIAKPQDLVVMKMLAFRERDRDDVMRLRELDTTIDWETVRQHVVEFCELLEDDQRLIYLDRLIGS